MFILTNAYYTNTYKNIQLAATLESETSVDGIFVGNMRELLFPLNQLSA